MGPGPKTPGQVRNEQRERYATDPVYRAKKQKSARDRHKEKRKEADA